MQESIYDEMFRLEQNHWWFAAKRRIVLALLRRYLPRTVGSRPRVCDLGCGCGMMLHDLREHGYEPTGVDASARALQYCRARGALALEGFLPDHLPVFAEPFDAVLLLDVLEHVEFDHQSLAAAASLVRPGGVILCTVPAHRWLWSPRDDAHHHFRRYDVKGFREVLASSGACRTELLSYCNCFLFPAAILIRMLSRIRPPGPAGDLHILPLGLNGLLREVFASESLALTHRIPFPVGLSLLAVLRKN